MDLTGPKLQPEGGGGPGRKEASLDVIVGSQSDYCFGSPSI
jgi:hypothetical protein